ncbi:hypothetical protein BGW36DRAFT_6722 [Talaromyces proteolyticus]|uniref:Uncharacterized protein n=1 Tax=Talaromyces proteolyticus TaxID=1131652 RepID=A0AAD4L4W2_9EURO|nr:uncharacterized protein BGW36DRAFT_6722 [Talaromyces proteolyticus]KAH8705091.1 hypothetical protein BGW36DRAFT_6722 [Talaromyces proteolyticus]
MTCLLYIHSNPPLSHPTKPHISHFSASLPRQHPPRRLLCPDTPANCTRVCHRRTPACQRCPVQVACQSANQLSPITPSSAHPATQTRTNNQH